MTKNNDLASRKYTAGINEYLAGTETACAEDISSEKISHEKNHSARFLRDTYVNRYRMKVIKRKYIF